MSDKHWHSDTHQVHDGISRTLYHGASSTPIFQTSTFHQEEPAHLGTWDYARSGNPTREALETTVAHLENGTNAYAFASGLAAIGSTLMLFEPGDHLVVGEDVYGGTYRLLTTIFQRWGLQVTWVDGTDPQKIADAITPRTKALYAETPSNPLLRITDLRAVADIAKRHHLLAITDNTFQTPVLQRPLDLGFDIVTHSATKFMGGHSDTVAGIAVVADPALGKRLYQVQNGFGAILGPQDAWLVLRGLRTLTVRIEAQQRNAALLADWLQQRPEVETVFYPGLASHPGHATHVAQSTHPDGSAPCGGAVVSFRLANGDLAEPFLKALRIPLVGVSLGGTETIMSWPRTMSHAAMPAPERAKRGITDGVIRVSAGLENIQDIIQDFQQSLEGAKP